MELKAGYKMTEVGVIPEDWNIATLEALVNPFRKITYGIVVPGPFIQNGIPLIRAQDYSKGWVSMENLYRVSIDLDISFKRSKVRTGDILLTIVGSVGNVAKVPKAFNNCNITQQTARLSFNPEIANADYYFNLLQSNNGEKEIFNYTKSGVQPSLNLSDVDKFLFPLPTIAEQTAIATALSDADALISSLEKLIAKKRNIKQGAMQKLLQPKKGWEVKRFSDVCWFQEGPGLRNWQFTKSGIKVINVTNLENGILNLERTARHISLEEFQKMYQHFEINENDIVVASSGNSYGKVALVRRKDLPLVMNTSVIRFKPLKELDFNFLWTFLKSNQFKDQIDLLITGGAQPNFGPAHLNKVYINMPASMEEQIQIATVFYDMDAEILSLETKLEKYRNIKLGMMQNLLTGKIRLV